MAAVLLRLRLVVVEGRSAVVVMTERATETRAAVESLAARMAYEAGLGASEWEAFVALAEKKIAHAADACSFPRGWLREELGHAQREVASWPESKRAAITPPIEPPKRSVWDD